MIEDRKFYPSSVQKIAVSRLIVFPEVQRDPPSKPSVQVIVSKFKSYGLGVMSVNHRGGGVFSLVDGQRRAAALKAMGMDSYPCLCNVHEGLTVAEEADMFRMLNRTRVASQFDDYSKGLVATDDECEIINMIADECGFRVQKHNAKGAINCVAMLRKVMKQDPSGDLLNRTLCCIRSTFGDHKNGPSTHIVGGIAKFLSMESGVSLDILAEKLRAAYAGPETLIARATLRKEHDGGTALSQVAYLVGQCYANRKKR